MALVTFDLSEDLARKVRGAYESGRSTAIILWFKNRHVTDVLVGDAVVNGRLRSVEPSEGRESMGGAGGG